MYICIIAFASSIIFAILYFATLHPPIRREQSVHLNNLHDAESEAILVTGIMDKGTTQHNDIYIYIFTYTVYIYSIQTYYIHPYSWTFNDLPISFSYFLYNQSPTHPPEFFEVLDSMIFDDLSMTDLQNVSGVLDRMIIPYLDVPGS